MTLLLGREASYLILFARTSGSEKHSEQAPLEFRWQKGSNPFGASENPKRKGFDLIHREKKEEIDKGEIDFLCYL